VQINSSVHRDLQLDSGVFDARVDPCFRDVPLHSNFARIVTVDFSPLRGEALPCCSPKCHRTCNQETLATGKLRPFRALLAPPTQMADQLTVITAPLHKGRPHFCR
jgi:hypothetical protein